MSEPLTDKRLAELANHDAAWHRDSTRDERLAIVLELQRLRAMEKRLEVWARELEASGRVQMQTGVGPFIAAELRTRMAG